MTISVGDTFPSLTVTTIDGDGNPGPLNLAEFLSGKTVAIFGVPGAFTPTCSIKHMPGFIEQAAALKAAGVDAIACHSVNDAFVMKAWAKDQNADGMVLLADGSADLTKALGLELDLTGAGLGLRCERYAAVVKDGTVAYLGVEANQSFGVSSAEAVLEAL